ncbi:MAG: 3-isopropylmalate dehydratase small subunit [Burkholderiaceae bacterium]
MTPFTSLQARVAPLDRANVDTDAIIPKQFIKAISKTGFGPYLFDEWRYLDRGELGQDCSTRPLNPDFVMNDARFAGAEILLARANFGCGSSREHAVWALADADFRVVIAPSFADIFHGNCFKNGLLPIVLEAGIVDRLFERAFSPTGLTLQVDLAAQTITPDGEPPLTFAIDAERKHRLLQGLDDVGLTLQHADRIRAYEAERRLIEPWLFH